MAELDKQIGVVASNLDDLSAKLQKVDANWGMVGSASSAALGVMVTALNKTNPVLATALSGLQKMAPMLTQIASAAKQSGAALKTALASTGVGLIVVALTSVVDVISSIKKKHDEQAKAASDAADAEKQAAADAESAWSTFYDKLTGYLDERTGGEKLLDEIDSQIESYRHEIALIDDAEKRMGGYINTYGERMHYASKDLATIADLEDKINVLSEKRLEIDKKAKGKGNGGPEDDPLKELYNLSATYVKDQSIKVITENIEKLKEALAKVPEGSNFHLYMTEAIENLQSELDVINRVAIGETIPAMDSVTSKLNDMAVAANGVSFGDYVSRSVSTLNTLNRPIASFIESNDILSESAKATWGSINSILLSTQDIMSNVTDSYTDDIQRQIDAGEISAKEGKKLLKRQASIQASLSMTAGISASVFATLEAWKSAPGGFIGKSALALSAAAGIIGTTMSAVQSIKAAGEGLESVYSPSSHAVSSAQGTTKTYTVNSAADAEKITNAIESGTSKAADSKVVLVVEDLNKVTDNMTRASVESSF